MNKADWFYPIKTLLLSVNLSWFEVIIAFFSAIIKFLNVIFVWLVVFGPSS